MLSFIQQVLTGPLIGRDTVLELSKKDITKTVLAKFPKTMTKLLFPLEDTGE